VVFLPSRPFVRNNQGSVQEYGGDDEFVAPNPSESAMITYYLKKRHIFGDMEIEVLDPENKKIKTLAAGKRKGINRVAVNMRLAPPRIPVSNTISYAGFFGPFMPPGEYTVNIAKNGKVYPGFFTIVDNPNLPYSAEDRKIQRETVMHAYTMLEDLAYLDQKITKVAGKAQALQQEGLTKSLTTRLKEMQDALTNIHKKLVATRNEGLFSSEEQLREKIAEIYGGVVNFMGRPTQSQIDRLEVLQKEMDEWKHKAEDILNSDLPKINSRLKKADIPEIKVLTREEFEKEDSRN
jgi:hypothetical protein